MKNRQLVVERKDEKTRIVPIEDIGYVVFENRQISFTLPLISALNENNVAVMFCNEIHMPTSLLLNLDSNNLQGELFRNQMNASEPLKKNLWKQTIEAKIKNQAALLKKMEKDWKSVHSLSGQVKSGDCDNREGSAARAYWPRLMGYRFIRDRFGAHPNQFLNYGYILLRAATARALAGSGLLATLGIHHHNRYNSYCLADDIMEPYRPFVDELVFNLHQSYPEETNLTTEIKAKLLGIMVKDVNMGKQKRPLSIALSQTTASLARAFSENGKKLLYPVLS